MLLSWRDADIEEQLWVWVCEITHITVRNDRMSLGGQTFGGTCGA